MRMFFALMLTVAVNAQTTIPAGYWPVEKSREILAKTETIRLAPDLSKLTEGERGAVNELIQVGHLFQKLYEESRHHQATRALWELQELDRKLGSPERTRNLLELYRLNQGPIAQTLDNQRVPFLPVDPQVPARNVYPVDATKEEIEAYLAKHPEQRESILGERTVVRRATKANLERDLGVVTSESIHGLFHPTLAHDLKSMLRKPDAKAFYAVPYSVAYARELTEAFRRLMHAAQLVEKDDAEFARYLRNRARDLITNDYEAGDASWVTGRFQKLNAQIGAYETYDDAMFGVKAFHAVSILVRNEAATAELREQLGNMQAFEDALPYESDKRIREDIPVGVYEVIADFGQARGTNTATILPNDALFSRRYGRTILLRENIMRHPDIFAADQRVWRNVTVAAHANDIAPEGNFRRTLWHEIGHYLGVDRDKQGRTLDVALQDYADASEEMKADLVSLFALHRMDLPPATLRAIQASGIRRTLQNVKPRTDQPYNTMQLVQFNWFLDKKLIAADAEGRLTVHYERYPEAVQSLLAEVLRLQHEGDRDATAAFFTKWTSWGETHEKVAARIREAQGARWRIVRYAAID